MVEKIDLSNLSSDVASNISSFVLGEPVDIRLKHNKALKKIQKNTKQTIQKKNEMNMNILNNGHKLLQSFAKECLWSFWSLGSKSLWYSGFHRFSAKRNRSILAPKGPRYSSRFECVVILVQRPCTHGSGSYIHSCHGMDVRDLAHPLNGDAVVHHPFTPNDS